MSNAAETTDSGTALTSEPPMLAVNGGVATITLRRPSTHNRIEPGDLAVLSGFLRELNDTPAVRVIVFQSTGKSFSSGFDLTRLGGVAANTSSEDYQNPFEELCDAFENARAVTIARLHAPVYGGATDLALSCDFRIGAESIRMFMPAARLGLHYYGHGMRRWVSRLGLGPAKKLFLTSRTIQAQEMLNIGYLDAVVPGEELDAEVQRWVDDLLAMAPGPVISMKQGLNAVARQQYDEQEAIRMHVASLASDDTREALSAFVEKRKPVFVGT